MPWWRSGRSLAAVPYDAAMRVPIFRLDAFTTRRFAGDPAAVVVLDRFLDDALMQAVAAENNLAETAFVVPSEGRYRLRRLTPTVEVPLCGHATLAAGDRGSARDIGRGTSRSSPASPKRWIRAASRSSSPCRSPMTPGLSFLG